MKIFFLIALPLMFFTACTKSNEQSTVNMETAPVEAVIAKKVTPEDINEIRLNTNLNQLAKEETPIDQYRVSLNVLQDGPFNEAVELPQSKQDLWKEAEQRVVRINKTVRSFEDGLDKTDIEFITQDNDSALSRRTDSFSSLATANGCRRTEFDKVVEKMSTRTVNTRLLSMMELAALYESGFEASYATRALQLIKKKEVPAEQRTDLLTFYNLKRTEGFAEERERDKRVSRSSQIYRLKMLLKDTGLTGEVRDQLLTEYTLLAPSCFGKFDANVREWINEAITESRGAQLIDRLKNMAHAQLREGFSDLADVVDGETDTTDAWGGEFKVEKENGEISLRSFGADRSPGTTDDMVIYAGR